jgi:tetratricopeptide (TPR) repeat protein
MKSILTRITLIFFLLFLFIPNLTFAELKTFIKEYSYQAGEADSKLSSRTLALQEVKRLLLEELGTYLESITEVQNFQLTKDQITMLTAGIVQTVLVEETWDGRTYWIKAKIKADSGDVIKSIDALRKDRQKAKELEEVRKRSDELLKENERLRKELATATGEKKQKDTESYNKTIEELNAVEWFKKGYADEISGNHNDAITAFTRAIELNPKYAKAYGGRGVAYSRLGKHNKAIKDFNKVIGLNPKNAEAYGGRGFAYAGLGNHNQAIKDYSKAIGLNPNYANNYNNRGVSYSRLDNHTQAIKDYSKAIELDPNDAKAYGNRGVAYSILGNTDQSIKDLNKAIKLLP